MYSSSILLLPLYAILRISQKDGKIGIMKSSFNLSDPELCETEHISFSNAYWCKVANPTSCPKALAYVIDSFFCLHPSAETYAQHKRNLDP